MQQYFVNFSNNDQYVKITGDDFHHIKNVMRMKIKDTIYVSNGQVVYYAVIKDIDQDNILVELQYEVKNKSELDIQVTIAQGMPKASKFETVIQKATELGVHELIPVLSERSLIKIDNKTEEKKIIRFNKIAKNAAEQSHRIEIPKVENFMKLNELINYSHSFDHKWVAYEASSKNEQYNLYRFIQRIKKDESLLIFIGPEGGISETEMSHLRKHQFEVISLGNRILRTETAPLFVMSAIIYELELKG